MDQFKGLFTVTLTNISESLEVTKISGVTDKNIPHKLIIVEKSKSLAKKQKRLLMKQYRNFKDVNGRTLDLVNMLEITTNY